MGWESRRRVLRLGNGRQVGRLIQARLGVHTYSGLELDRRAERSRGDQRYGFITTCVSET